VASVEKAAEADRDARLADAIKVFEKEGLVELREVQGRPRKEVVGWMNKVIADLRRGSANQQVILGEFAVKLSDQKDMLAHFQRAADLAEADQKKLGGLNMAIFALDGALRVVGANPATK